MAEQLQVSFLRNDTYAGVSGLTRYEQELFQALAGQPSLSTRQLPIGPPPVPRGLIALAKRLGYDLAAFHQNYPLRWPHGLSGLVHLTRLGQATLLTRQREHPVVVMVHDIIHYKYRNDPSMHIYRHPIQAWFDALAVQQLKKADAILVNSQYTRQCLIDIAGVPPNKIHVVYLGIHSHQFRPLEVPQAFYQRYGLNRQTPYILHISSEEPRKNVPRMLQAFAKVQGAIPDAILLKIGRPLYPEQRQRHLTLVKELGIQDSVIFIDNVPDEDLPGFYNVSKLLLFPSLEEGFGFPVLEAMACGTPVVCSRLASLPELTEEAAVLINPYIIEEIVEATSQLLSNPHLFVKMSSESITQAKKFSWQRTASQTIDVYQKVMESFDAV